MSDEESVNVKRDRPVQREEQIPRSTIVVKVDPNLKLAHGTQKTWVHKLFQNPLPISAVPVEPLQGLPKGSKCLLFVEDDWIEVTVEAVLDDRQFDVSFHDGDELKNAKVSKKELIIEKTELANIIRIDELSEQAMANKGKADAATPAGTPLVGSQDKEEMESSDEGPKPLIDKSLSGYRVTLTRTGRLKLPLVRLLYEEFGYPIPEAKKLVNECPSLVAAGLEKEAAKELMSKMKRHGARVSMELVK